MAITVAACERRHKVAILVAVCIAERKLLTCEDARVIGIGTDARHTVERVTHRRVATTSQTLS